jgi:creatinine amidohydrolase
MNAKAPAFQELSTARIAALPAERCLAVWPVASLEQHGPHLPLGTDALILQAIVEAVRLELGENFPALFLPMLTLGKSPEHLSFPGTVSLRAATLLDICEDVVSSLAAHGFRHFVFLNGHGGNTALLQSFGYDLRHKYQATIYNIDLWASDFFDQAIANLFPQLVGKEVHAASAEVAMMMHLYPHLVGDVPQVTAPQGFGQPVHHSWASDDFHSQGVIGDPSQASPEKGEALIHYAVKKVVENLTEISQIIET